jgi:hypothetical protein
MAGPRWSLPGKRDVYAPGPFKTYENLWEGENQVVPANNQGVGQGVGGFWLGEGSSWAKAWLI